MADVGQDGTDVEYPLQSADSDAAHMYAFFVDALRIHAAELLNNELALQGTMEVDEVESAPQQKSFLRDLVLGPADDVVVSKGPKPLSIVAGDFYGSNYLDMKCAGPFMHSFT